MINALKISYDLTLSKFRFLLLPMFLDVLTFIFIGSIYSYSLLQAIPHFEEISKITGFQMQSALAAQSEEQMSVVLANMDLFYVHYNAIIWIIVYLALGLLVTWVVLQSSSWYVTSNIIGRKVKFFKYVGEFVLLTVVALIGYVLISYVLFRLLFLLSITEVVFDARYMPHMLLTVGILVLFLVITGYINIGTSLLKGIKSNITNPKYLGLLFILAVLVLIFGVFITWFVRYLAESGVYPMLVLPIILLVFPLLSYARVSVLNEAH